MAAEYLIQTSVDQQVTDISSIAGLDDDNGEEVDKNLLPLHCAAWYNKLEAVKSLLRYGTDPNEEDKEGATALHFAARYKRRVCRGVCKNQSRRVAPNNAVVRTLIEAGARVNKQENYGVTPLMFATLRGNEDAVSELLSSKGTCVNIKDNRGWTALFFAAKYDRVSIASRLIEAGADIFVKDSYCGVTPMHLACKCTHVDIINMLFTASKGREKKLLDAQTVHGVSCLDEAVEHRRSTVVELCIQYGVTAKKTAKENHVSPLHICAAVGGPKIARMLIDYEELLIRMRTTEQMTPLHKAAQYGRGSVARILIERGSDLEAKDAEGNTPLLIAAKNGHESIIRILLKSGAEITAMNRSDHTAIHLACGRTNSTSLKILIKSCKKQNESNLINSEDKLGRTALYMACEAGFEYMAKILLEAGADCSSRTENEELPIHVATRKGYIECVRTLLDHTASCEEANRFVSEEDENTNTCLHLAAYQGHAAIAQALLDCGADIDGLNRFNLTPVCYAAQNGHNDVLEVLLKAGADPEIQDSNCDTPMHYAARNGHHKVLRTLLKTSANACVRNSDGNNVLDEAINNNNKAAAETILGSDQWRIALRNRTPNRRSHVKFDVTPLRKLVHLMPELVEKVLDRCIDISDGKTKRDPQLCLNFDMEFLDDTYAATLWGDPECVIGNHAQKNYKERKAKQKAHKVDGCPYSDAIPYTCNHSIRHFNHPLMVMVKYRRTGLLYHPLCLALIHHKWDLAKYYFFAFVMFYGLFVAMITNYMVNSDPPYSFVSNHSLTEYRQFTQCQKEIYAAANSTITTNFRTRMDSMWLPRRHSVVGLTILIGSVIGIITELIQLIGTKISYILNSSNALDWFSYMAAIFVVIPVEPCRQHLTHWQWQLGTCCMFVAWINLILFLRRMPRMGIYIVMVGEVFETFMKFFLFCFSFFLLAFGFTFYVLMENQQQFSTVFYSCAKVAVMMIGELEYADLFHETDIPYEGLTYAIFLIFLCLVTIIIMNLLTGLAVGDVQEIQEHAKLKKMAIQADFALNVEVSLPEFLRKKFQCVKTKQTIYPNETSSNLFYKLGNFARGPLAAKNIANAIFNGVDQDVDTDNSRTDLPSSATIHQFFTKLSNDVENNKDELTKLDAKIDQLQDAVKTILDKVTEANRNETNEDRQNSVDISSSDADQSAA